MRQSSGQSATLMTDFLGEKCFKTPTYYALKLFKEHTEQYLAPILPDDIDERLNALATISEDGESMTVSFVNRDLYEDKKCCLQFKESEWLVEKSDILTAENVRDMNTFECPEKIKDVPYRIEDLSNILVPAHSILRICLKKSK